MHDRLKLRALKFSTLKPACISEACVIKSSQSLSSCSKTAWITSWKAIKWALLSPLYPLGILIADSLTGIRIFGISLCASFGYADWPESYVGYGKNTASPSNSIWRIRAGKVVSPFLFHEMDLVAGPCERGLECHRSPPVRHPQPPVASYEQRNQLPRSTTRLLNLICNR